MSRPFTRVQTLQNRAFLRALARTGNARAAARAIGMHRATLTKRRAAHPAFAAQWDAALALAHAAINAGDAPPRGDLQHHRTASGRVQLRRPGGRRRLTRAAEQAFLSALSATANVRLAAKAAGFSHAAFYARRRQSPGFAREMRLALQEGYERIEAGLLEAGLPEAHDHDDWRHNDRPAMPPMTVNQALQLLYLHQKEARLDGEHELFRTRRGESREVRAMRLQLTAEHRRERERERSRVAEAERRARGELSLWEMWRATAELPDLGQVTGWSKAKPEPHAVSGANRETANSRPAGGEADPSDDAKPHVGSEAGRETAPARPAGPVGGPTDDAGFNPASGPTYHPDRALFGGWRVGDIPKEKRRR